MDTKATGGAAARGGLWWAVAGLVLALGGVPAYLALIDVPFLRTTGLAALVTMGLGAVLAGLALRRDSRRWVRVLGIADLALVGCLTFAYYALSVLPKPADAATSLVAAPDFTLRDERGREVSLKASYSAGPVLLVFYRGHW